MQRLFLEFFLRAALTGMGTAAILEILRVKTAGARHAAWASVVVVMLMLPVWTAWGPKAPLRVLPAIGAPATSRVTVPATASAGVPPAQRVNLKSSQRASRSSAVNWWTCLACLYLLGVATLLSRLAIGTVRAHLLIRRAANREGTLTSSSCVAPVTVGWLRPTVILPECWREWPRQRLEAVWAHEREHARRRDPLVQWLALLNRALFWFHPLAWWLERRLSGLAEEACDAAVLAHGHDPYEYSECLLEMARSVVRSGARVKVLGMAMPGSFLTDRIRQILEGSPAPRLTRARTVWATAACAILSVTFLAGAVDRRKPQPYVSPELSGPSVVRTSDSKQDVSDPAPVVPTPRTLDTRTKPIPSAGALLAQVQSSPPPASQNNASPSQPLYADRRLLAMYFDLADLTEEDLARAIGAAQKFVRTQLKPQDVVSIMTYRSGAVRVMQDFTDDQDKLVKTLNQVTGAQSPNSGEVPSADRPTMLRTAIQMLGSLSQKKSLILFTSGASRGRESQADLQELTDAAVKAQVALYPIDARGLVIQPR